MAFPMVRKREKSPKAAFCSPVFVFGATGNSERNKNEFLLKKVSGEEKAEKFIGLFDF